MVAYCCVYGCKNSALTSGIRFHRFPKFSKVAAEWTSKLKMGKPYTKTMCVCSAHFKDDDYRKPPVSEWSYKAARLNRLAVPSENLPKGSVDRDINCKLVDARNRRSLKRQKRLKKVGLPPKNQRTNERLPPKSLGIDESTEVSPNLDIDHSRATSCDAVIGFNHPSNIFTDKCVGMDTTFSVDKCVGGDSFVGHKCKLTTDVLSSDEAVSTLTGLPNYKLFTTLILIIEEKFPPHWHQLKLKERLFLTFMKLKQGTNYAALGVLFGVNPKVASANFKQTICQLSIILQTAVVWLEKEQISENLPKCFSNFKKTRVVLDCTEVPVERPQCLRCRILTYSHYKGTHTCKILVGVAPSGAITFISKAYGGRISDKEQITEQSGVIDKCLSYIDDVMVDKGFAIDNLCLEKGLGLIRPPFLEKKKQFSSNEATATAEIARARVHVERAISRLKVFKILQSKLDWDLLPYVQNIFNVSAGLVNLSTPILSGDKF